jgi:hypothetical protein
MLPILSQGIDATVIQTSLREMEEELGIPAEKAEVSTHPISYVLDKCNDLH